MKIAIDNDFFCKTELLGVAELVRQAFDVNVTDCFVLPSLAPQLRNKRKSSRLYKKYEQQADFLESRLPDYSVLPQSPETEWTNRFVGVDGIDPGEATMLSFLVSSDIILFATHDKNCLRAIPKVPGLVQAIQGRVVVLEDAISKACQVHGVSAVHNIASQNVGRTGDNAMKACFGGQESSVLEALKSYRTSLCSETDSTILWTP